MVYFTYSEGFRRGGVNSARPQSIYGSVPGFDGDPDAGTYNTYESDTVINYEIGAKTEWLDNTVRFNITAYFMEWEDIQIQVEDTITGTFSLGTVNAPEAEIKGVEAWLAWAPTDAWSITSNISYNEGELSKDFTFPEGSTDILASKGTKLPLMPDWKASVNGQYTFSGQLFSATPYVLAQYTYWGDSVNSIGIESTNFTHPVKKQAAWQTLDLRTGLDGESWSAVIYMDNVFDEYKKSFFNNRWAQQRLSVGQPRTLGVGFRVNFGD
jgi:outer membrane receptor protein involved in Fe transport